MLAMQLEDHHEMLEPAIRLVELQPYVPAHHFNLHGVYMQNVFVALALQTGHDFLRRWPDLDLGNDIRKDIETFTPFLKEEAVKHAFPEDKWLEYMALHDRVQVALRRNRLAEVERLAADLLKALPHFVPAYNNRSLAYFANGQMQEAIADERKALEIDPDNVHALGNLTRFLRLNNQLAEAKTIAERLKNAAPAGTNVWAKKAEAFSYLLDDATVLQVVEQAEQAGELWSKHADPFLLHLGGVAAARLGDEKRARQLWEAGLQNNPGWRRTRENLDDLEKPLGEREGAWPFETADWFSRRLYDDLINTFARVAGSKTDKKLEETARRFIEKHPHLMPLVPILLERGDPSGRQVILAFAEIAETAESIEILKNFAHGPHGPDKLRFKALQFLQERQIIKPGEKISFWSRGEQTTIFAMNWRIDDTPYEKLPPAAQEPARLGFMAMQKQDMEEARKFLTKALVSAPHSASLQFNLATIEAYEGQIASAIAKVRKLAVQHPKYSFAHCKLALHALANDRIAEAHDYLKPVMALEHLHADEFINLCQAQILLAVIGDQKFEAAKQWLEMWERFAPDHPKLEIFRPLTKDFLFARMKAMALIHWLREKN
ncbi:MAG: Beta-barrel assembly-enhancing protease [bacterium]|nr:Beta-barrel assembly-enhancing protease [bacterium]